MTTFILVNWAAVLCFGGTVVKAVVLKLVWKLVLGAEKAHTHPTTQCVSVINNDWGSN